MIPFELILKLKGFPVLSAMQVLKTFNGLLPQEKANQIESKKWEQVKYHIAHNSLYRSMMRNVKLDVWSSLPIIRKGDLQKPLPSLLSESYRPGNVYVSTTSGSSGHPFSFARDKFTHALVWAFILDAYQKLGITSRSLQGRFYGIPLGKRAYYSELLKDYLMNRTRFIVFDMGDEALGDFLKRFESRRIEYIYGYTNSLLLFAKYLHRKGIVLKDRSPKLFLCIATSELCTEEDKHFLESVFGIPLVREYGASELDVIAIEDIHGRWAVNECNLFVEVVSDTGEPLPLGQEGRLLITSLHNRAMPFIRYEVGDRGSLESDEHGLILKQLSGRNNDTILLPSGKKSPGFTFYYISRNILEKNGILKEFIIRQTALDMFEFDVVPFAPLTEKDIAQISKIVEEYLEPGLQIRINQVDKIQRPPSGKIKHFYSDIK